MLLSLQNVGLSFGAEQIFEHLSVSAEPGERIALIGPNGAGKTTLLNLIVGTLSPDEGEIARQPGIRIGYLRQNGGLAANGTIESELHSALSEVFALERRLQQTRERMAALQPHDTEQYRVLEEEYQQLDARFLSLDGYQAEVKLSTVLTGMGFGSFDRRTAVSSLSGGERTRLMLCKLLLEAPDLLILDEATNHLDFKMLAWLEEYLSSYKGAILTVSHDRYFLDRVTGVTWELEGLSLVRYPASYSGYLRLRAERIERLEKEYERYCRERERLLDYAERNMARASTSQMAKSRLRMAEHLEEAERPIPPPKPPAIRFSPKLRPVLELLEVRELTLAVGKGNSRRTLLERLDLSIRRGDRLAVVGENGAGKSTLLRTLCGRLSPDAGEIEWGRNVRLSVFEQDSSELHGEKTALEELWDRFPQQTEHSLRTLLGSLGLTGEESKKQVGVLSGGERARVKLAIAMLEQGNVLLLDEPTNHLDIPSKEALEQALLSFEGTLIVVSHDRWLLSKIPTSILRLADGSAVLYRGGFEEMQRQLAAQQAPAAKPVQRTPSQGAAQYHKGKAQRAAEAAQKRRLAELEREIEQAELDIAALEESLADPNASADYQVLTAMTEELDRLHQRRDALYAELDALI